MSWSNSFPSKNGRKEPYDVVVIGAGLSGLTAAYDLLSVDPDLRVLVLEAKDRVGGRTLTMKLKTVKGTDSWDLGGQWVTDAQHHIMDLLLELGLDTFQQYDSGTKILQISNGELRHYRGSIPKLSLLSLLDLQWFIYKFEKLSRQIDVDDMYSHPRAAELDATTLESYVSKNTFMAITKDMLTVAVKTALGFEPSQMSVLYLLMYAKCAGGLMELFETTPGCAQEKRVQGGAQQISERLVKLIGKENVKLSSPAKAIHQDTSLTEVITENDDHFLTKFVIMAIPLQLAANIEFKPPLPEKRRLLLNNMPMGHLTKYVCTYTKAFWRENGFSGEVVSDGGLKLVDSCDAGPLGIVYDATTHNDNPALVGFIGGNQGIQWTSKPYEMRKLAILRALAQCFGDEALQPLEYVEKIWSSEPYNGGCPVNVASPGVMVYMSEHFRTPVGRIHWAGTETATSWRGFMNGAVQTGRRAAKEVLFHLRPASITAKDLHDTIYKKQCLMKASARESHHYLYVIATVLFGILVFFYMCQIVE